MPIHASIATTAALDALLDGPWDNPDHRETVVAPYRGRPVDAAAERDQRIALALADHALRVVAADALAAVDLDAEAHQLRDIETLSDADAAARAAEIAADVVRAANQAASRAIDTAAQAEDRGQPAPDAGPALRAAEALQAACDAVDAVRSWRKGPLLSPRPKAPAEQAEAAARSTVGCAMLAWAATHDRARWERDVRAILEIAAP